MTRKMLPYRRKVLRKVEASLKAALFSSTVVELEEDVVVVLVEFPSSWSQRVTSDKDRSWIDMAVAVEKMIVLNFLSSSAVVK